MNVINSVTNSVHLDWHAAGMRPRLERAYSGGDLHFLVITTDEEAPGEPQYSGSPATVTIPTPTR